jgi:hypothetical protein
VLSFSGSDKLEVQNDAGATYRVQYIGLRGPVRSSLVHAEAAALHGPLVIGQRVLLEPDGADQVEGYQQRHAYLEGESVPLGARIVAAGWARATPYPAEHRHRQLYWQLQEEAFSQQRGLWRPNLLGPAQVWRPAGSSEPGYIAADPRLHPHFELLDTVPTGHRIVQRLLELGPSFALRELPGRAGALTEPISFTTTVNARLLDSDPRGIAALVGHEGAHLIDFAANATGLTSFGCFELEVRAHTVEAQVWSEFYGPAGKPTAESALDQTNNDLLRFAARGDIANYVRLSPSYQTQCAGLPD